MTWITFFAGRKDFAGLLSDLFALDQAQLFEVYSVPGTAARSFATAPEALDALPYGVDTSGGGIATHCAFWFRSVMPPPVRRRIDLRAGGWRESIAGCGLVWLQTGGIHEDAVTESTIGWFTEGAARQKCIAEPGPAAVDWSAHAKLVAKIRSILRKHAVARAGRFAVLPEVAEMHKAGARLLYGVGTKRQICVDAP